MDRATAGIDDPAEVFATSLRMSGRLGGPTPTWPASSRRGPRDAASSGRAGAASAADIQLAQAAGRFVPGAAEVGLSAVAGGLIELLRLRTEQPGSLTEDAVDGLARGMLRFFGLSDEEAAAIVAKPLPSYDDGE